VHIAQTDVLVIGEINPDLIIADPDSIPVFGQVEKVVQEISLRIGSSAAIFACGAARLGLRTAFVGVLGDDVFGHFMLQEMSARGVDTSACILEPSLPTGISVIHTDGDDRAILTFPGSIGSLRVAQIPPELVRRTRHVHVSSYYLLTEARSHLPGLFAEARRGGATTSFDCNWDPDERWTDGLEAMLDESDIFFLNAEEARRITGCSDECAAGRRLASGRQTTVVVKRGSDGAVSYAGADAISVPAPLVTPVDCVGAGDSFDAGYICAWLHNRSPQDSLRLAVACGTLSTQGRGGSDAQPSLAAAETVARAEALAAS
jgi:sugar/nucleoside kinase (ribokinase family)